MNPRRPYSFVYGLRDPGTGEIRYVGQSVQPSRRFRSHYSTGGGYVRDWLKSLPCPPQLRILGRYPQEDGTKWETYWIDRLREEGCRLLNKKRIGGQGVFYGFAVRCIETGQVFESYCQAGRAYGVSGASIRKYVRKGEACWRGDVHFEHV